MIRRIIGFNFGVSLVVAAWMFCKGCVSSELEIKNCYTSIQIDNSGVNTNNKTIFDLMINCLTTKNYYRCQLREKYNENYEDFCNFRMGNNLILKKPHCTSDSLLTRIDYKIEQANKNTCKLKVLNIGNPQLNDLTIRIQPSFTSDEWKTHRINTTKLQDVLDDLNYISSLYTRTSLNGNTKVCNDINLDKIQDTNYNGPNIQGTYRYQHLLLKGKPVYLRSSVGGDDVYLYWNKRRKAWSFGSGLNSRAIWLFSKCHEIDPSKCKNWKIKRNEIQGVKIGCGMGGMGHSTLPTSIHAPKVTKSVSQKYTLFGTVGGSITLLSATIMIAIYNSRKRKNREMVQQQRSRIRQSFVELYLTNRFTTSDMIRFN